MRAARLAAAFALGLLLAPAARAFVRSGDPDTKSCLYWSARDVTYRVNVTRAGSSPSCGPVGAANAPAVSAIVDGFGAWTAPSCTDLTLSRGQDTTSIAIGFARDGADENLVVFRKGWCDEDEQARADPCWTDPGERCSAKFNCFGELGTSHSTIALTTTTYRPSSGEIVDADMEFVDWTGAGGGGSLGGNRPEGWYFTCFEPSAEPACTTYGQDGCFSMDLQNTATHEAGHFVGLAHNPEDAETTMAATAAPGETKKRSLTEDDEAGVCAIYPRGAPPAVCASRDDDGGGCASGGGAGVLGLLSLLALGRRYRTTTPA